MLQDVVHDTDESLSSVTMVIRAVLDGVKVSSCRINRSCPRHPVLSRPVLPRPILAAPLTFVMLQSLCLSGTGSIGCRGAGCPRLLVSCPMPAWHRTTIQDGRAAHISQVSLSESRPSCRGGGGGGADCFSSSQTSVSPPGGPGTGSTHSCSKVSHVLPLKETRPLCCATSCLSLSSSVKMDKSSHFGNSVSGEYC